MVSGNLTGQTHLEVIGIEVVLGTVRKVAELRVGQ